MARSFVLVKTLEKEPAMPGWLICLLFISPIFGGYMMVRFDRKNQVSAVIPFVYFSLFSWSAAILFGLIYVFWHTNAILVILIGLLVISNIAAWWGFVHSVIHRNDESSINPSRA